MRRAVSYRPRQENKVNVTRGVKNQVTIKLTFQPTTVLWCRTVLFSCPCRYDPVGSQGNQRNKQNWSHNCDDYHCWYPGFICTNWINSTKYQLIIIFIWTINATDEKQVAEKESEGIIPVCRELAKNGELKLKLLMQWLRKINLEHIQIPALNLENRILNWVIRYLYLFYNTPHKKRKRYKDNGSITLFFYSPIPINFCRSLSHCSHIVYLQWVYKISTNRICLPISTVPFGFGLGCPRGMGTDTFTFTPW